MHSIRRKLLITLIGALLAAGFTTAAATFFSAQTEFNKFLDTHLKETAESLAQSVTHSFPLADPDHLTIIGDAQSYHIVVQVYDSANNTVWQREDQPYLPLPDAPALPEPSSTVSTGAPTLRRLARSSSRWARTRPCEPNSPPRPPSASCSLSACFCPSSRSPSGSWWAAASHHSRRRHAPSHADRPRLSNPSRRRGFRLSSQASSAPSTNCWTDCAKASPHSSASPPTPLTNSARR